MAFIWMFYGTANAPRWSSALCPASWSLYLLAWDFVLKHRIFWYENLLLIWTMRFQLSNEGKPNFFFSVFSSWLSALKHLCGRSRQRLQKILHQQLSCVTVTWPSWLIHSHEAQSIRRMNYCLLSSDARCNSILIRTGLFW